MKNKLFVYGNLKQGFPSHLVLTGGGANFLGSAKVTGAFHLHLHPNGYPVMVRTYHDKGKGCEYGERIEGEIWEVSDELLFTLDRTFIETGFIRQLVRILGRGGGYHVYSYVYLGDVTNLPNIGCAYTQEHLRFTMRKKHLANRKGA
jgi:gamma-glutamylcyclotransferase (GGCT)/AIG2-like uncharacterized protein YtfP